MALAGSGGGSVPPSSGGGSTVNPDLQGKPTVSQVDAAAFASRMRRAHQQMLKLESSNLDELQGWWAEFAIGAPRQVSDRMRSGKAQVYYDAAKQFVLAILRRDTGAAVTKEEWEQYGPLYLVMPADKPDRIRYKQREREAVIEDTARSAGEADAGESSGGQGKTDLDVTWENIDYTAELYGMSREEVYQKLLEAGVNLDHLND